MVLSTEQGWNIMDGAKHRETWNLMDGVKHRRETCYLMDDAEHKK